MGKRRGEVHFADEELLLVPDEMPVGGVGEFVEDDMVRDACRVPRDAFDLEVGGRRTSRG